MKTYTGKTLQDVLDTIKTTQNVTTNDIVYEVIEEKTGFLGIGAKVQVKAYTYKDIIQSIKTYLEHYLQHLNLAHAISVEKTADGYKVLLDSKNNATLIGRNGQTLLSLNTVLRAHLQSEFKKFIRVIIDINGYKDQKYEKLKRIAYRIAKEVQRTKITASLDPMPNDERKVIHQYLTNLPYIRTISEGEAHHRYITIVYDPNK